DLPPGEYDFVATMGCGDSCPHIPARHREDWQIPDPKHLDPVEFKKVRDLIEAKVKAALAVI
ncbi:MAG: arsenate reductase ArsC, partial [Chthoniobacterales bacterium]